MCKSFPDVGRRAGGTSKGRLAIYSLVSQDDLGRSKIRPADNVFKFHLGPQFFTDGVK